MNKVSIVICAYNNKDIIGKCIKSVLLQTCKDFKIYLVDDNSSDGTEEYIKNNYPSVVFYKKSDNSGPSISRNIGMSISDSEYIAFMDSDVELNKRWLEECIYLMDRDESIGICGSKLLYKSSKDKINSIGGAISRIGVGFDVAKGQKNKKFKTKQFLFVCSAAILVRRSMLKKIGGFDDTFFYSYEDTDLGWRANIAGYEVIFNPKAIVYHNLNETVKKIPDRVYFNSTKNRIRMLIKNYEIHNLIIYLPLLVLISIFDVLLRSHKIAKIKGIFWNLSNLKSTIKERSKVQSLRIKKDYEMFSLFDDKFFRL